MEEKQSYILRNASLLNIPTRRIILQIVMQEIGTEAIIGSDKQLNKNTNIDLDYCEKNNPEIIEKIYKIVKTYIERLDKPIS